LPIKSSKRQIAINFARQRNFPNIFRNSQKNTTKTFLDKNFPFAIVKNKFNMRYFAITIFFHNHLLPAAQPPKKLKNNIKQTKANASIPLDSATAWSNSPSDKEPEERAESLPHPLGQ
jgi:hypothetical protein